MVAGSTYEQFRQKINEIVTKMLGDYEPAKVRDKKVIRDPIWGFTRYHEHEIALIDSPIIQRLRNLFQTSLALFTYPAAVHSRFEHSLACVGIAEKMMQALKANTKEPAENSAPWLEVRLAALLHDCGHGPLSHLSESFYGQFDEFRNLVNERGYIFQTVKQKTKEPNSASEIFSYFIVTSDPFKTLWEEVKTHNADKELNLKDIELERVALMILGRSKKAFELSREQLPKNYEYRDDLDRCSNMVPQKYLAQIINGPYDCDKIDYLLRDGHFTGLPTTIDVDRFLLNLECITDPTLKEKILCVDLGGVHVLEQILFSKMLLYGSVYHHPKVRAAACAFTSLLERMRDNGWKIKKLDLSSPFHFLELDDYDIFNSLHSNQEFAQAILSIKNRDLYKRALVLTPKSLANKDPKNEKSQRTFMRLKKNSEMVNTIRSQIAKQLKLPIYDIHFDFPSQPAFEQIAVEGKIKMEDDIIVLKELYPVTQWISGYANFRSRAYIFCPQGHQEKVAEISLDVLKENGILCNERALQFARQDPLFIQRLKNGGKVLKAVS